MDMNWTQAKKRLKYLANGRYFSLEKIETSHDGPGYKMYIEGKENFHNFREYPECKTLDQALKGLEEKINDYYKGTRDNVTPI
jgi:hypothetical protein